MNDVDTIIKRMDKFLCIRDGVLPTIPMAFTLEDREWLTLRAEIYRLRSELAAANERNDALQRTINKAQVPAVRVVPHAQCRCIHCMRLD